MSRQPAPDVKITEALQPQAAVHGTYWRPAQPEPSPLHAVARSLASLSEDLTSTFEKMDAKAAVDAEEKGAAAFWTGQTPGASQEGIAEGYRQGVLPLWGSKAATLYEHGYQKAQGMADGAALQGRIMERYNQLPEDQKLAMTPEEFNVWMHESIRTDPMAATANKSGGYAKGITPQIREIYSKVTDRWNADKTKDAQIKASNAWGSALTSTLEQHSLDGKSKEGGMDYAQATADIQAIREAGFKSGLRQDEIDKQVAASIIERATLDRDPTMLTMLDTLKTPEGKPLSHQPNIQAAKNAASTSISALREQDRQRAQSEQDRADKQAHDGSLRTITEGFMKDVNATPDPKDVANVYRRDPQAEATILKLRQTIADGKQFEDPEKIAQLTREIYNGGGWDALRRGMSDIKTAKTLKEVRDAVINMETYQQGDTKLFESQSWKRLENFITDAGKGSDVGGSAFREPALTAASLGALNDARIIGLKWAQAHPNATAIEKEQFISELTQQFLPSITKPDGNPIYTQPESVKTAREAPTVPGATTPAAPPAGAPAGSPAAPTGQQNPMLRPGTNSTAPPPAIKPWIQELAKSPDAPPRYEQMQIGAEYRKDIEERAQKLGKDPQWVIDRAWEKLKANIDAARGVTKPQAAPAPAPVPQAPVQPTPGPRSEVTIPGLGSIDLASVDQNTLQTIAGQIMQRVQLNNGELAIPGVGKVQFTPEGQQPPAPPASNAFPVQKASLTVDPAQTLAMAATQEGVDLGARIRSMPADNSGITATNGGPVVGQGLTQVSQRRVAAIDKTPSGAIIDGVAKQLGFSPEYAKAMAHIESSGNPNASTGSYHGLFQLSAAEFKKFGPNDGRSIMDPEANAIAGIRSMQAKSAAFKREFGRDPSPTEVYLMHQQGEGGLREHSKQPNRLAWESMAATGEGRAKGERWSKLAVWGNVPDDMKPMFGSVDNMTSAQFIAVWMNKLQGVPYQQALGLLQQGVSPQQIATPKMPNERDV